MTIAAIYLLRMTFHLQVLKFLQIITIVSATVRAPAFLSIRLLTLAIQAGLWYHTKVITDGPLAMQVTSCV